MVWMVFMARSRNIKPGFFANEDLAECDPLARILFTGLWCLSDREGRLEDRPKRIRAEVLPYDLCDADQLLNQLQDHGFILRYQNGSDRYIQVLNFTKHQMPHHKEVASVIPAPEGMPTITRHPYNVPDQTRSAVFKRDGNACLKCGSTEALSIDHVMPLSKGGSNEIGNLQTLCSRCNSSKGDSTKDYRSTGDGVTKSEDQTNVDPTLSQRQPNEESTMVRVAPLIPDSLIPDSLIPDSGFLGGEGVQDIDSVGSEKTQPTPAQTSAPADLQPTVSHRSIALNMHLDLGNEKAMFLANARSKGRMSADWDAEFELWLRRSRNFGNGKDQQPVAGKARNGGASVSDQNREAAERAKARIFGGQPVVEKEINS